MNNCGYPNRFVTVVQQFHDDMVLVLATNDDGEWRHIRSFSSEKWCEARLCACANTLQYSVCCYAYQYLPELGGWYPLKYRTDGRIQS